MLLISGASFWTPEGGGFYGGGGSPKKPVSDSQIPC